LTGSPWLQLLAVALGGAVGGALRHLLSVAVSRRMGDAFPWGTLAVNTSGALALGILIGAHRQLVNVDDLIWLLFGVGVLGSYTTVSSLSLQSLQLAQARAYRPLAAYLLVSVVAGLAAGLLGVSLAGPW